MVPDLPSSTAIGGVGFQPPETHNGLSGGGLQEITGPLKAGGSGAGKTRSACDSRRPIHRPV